mgnify:CR=1 FL=1
MDRKLLDLLVCPRTHQPLALADAGLLQRINAAASGGSLRRIDGSVHDQPVREALVVRDGTTAYRVDDGIPVLLVDEGLDLRELAAR